MGADISKAEKFWETYDDTLLVVLWYNGYWGGYVGFKSIDKQFPTEVYFHMGSAVGNINTAVIPEIGISVNAVGFDTNHCNDVNIGPAEQRGNWHRNPWDHRAIIWDKKAVFQRLREVVDKVKSA